MITHIHIKDFAIIEEIDIDIHPGLNIITGETGAGKSIVIEAVSMALGSRADTALVRSGREKALIQILFDESDLPENRRSGIELLTREISANGKSVCRVNGEIVTLTGLAELTKRLVDIHGQYDHQSLLDAGNHLGIVDAFHAEAIEPARLRVKSQYQAYASIRTEMDALLADEASAQREVDLLRYEVKEIEHVRPVPGEYAILTENLKRMQHSERIFARLTEAYGALSAESPSAIDAAGRARLAVADISDIAEDYKDLSQSLSDCYFELEEIVSTLRGMLDGIDHSTRSIDETIARIDQLDRLINKYAKNAEKATDDPLESVIAYRDLAAKRLDNIESLDSRKAELDAALKKTQDGLLRESCVLSRLRKKAAEALDVRVNAELLALNFNNAQFQAAFQNGTEEPDLAMLSENGIDRMEFLLSANKGQPLLPVAKVASGGEMSRIMLALKAVVGAFDQIPTMIFDEIDTGVSGVTASIVGEKLREIAQDRQIVCITHLPQIAACADHHFVIEKNSDESATYTTIREVTGEDRVSDIARMLGGRTITPATIAGAEELIALSRV